MKWYHTKSYEGHTVVMRTDFLLLHSEEFLLWCQGLIKYAEKTLTFVHLCNVAQKLCTWVGIFLTRLFLLGRGPEILIYLKDNKTWASSVSQRNFHGSGSGGKVAIRKAQNFSHLSEEMICTLYWHWKASIHLSVGKRTGDFFLCILVVKFC